MQFAAAGEFLSVSDKPTRLGLNIGGYGPSITSKRISPEDGLDTVTPDVTPGMLAETENV